VKTQHLKLLLEAFLGAVLSAAWLFVLQGRFGFSLWDEGHLWYGAKQVLAGEVPILDFRSYDPGRYYWAAFWMRLFGNEGVLALRAATWLFLIPGLTAVWWTLRRYSSRLGLFFCAVAWLTLSVWLFPRHKLFDISISMMLVAAMARLLEKPGPRCFFVNGLVVGLAALFGRNHGVYGLAGGALVLLHVMADRRRHQHLGWSSLWCWPIGVVVGYFPMLFMAVAVPGFFAAFKASLLFTPNTVLQIPVPWPWTFSDLNVQSASEIRQFVSGVCLVLLLVFGVIGSLVVMLSKRFRKRTHPVLAASFFMAVSYAHHALSRADMSHLAQGIFPLLLGGFFWLSRKPRVQRGLLGSIVLIVSLFLMLPVQPGWQGRTGSDWSSQKVGDDTFLVAPSVAASVRLVTQLAERYASDGQSFLIVPFWPGAYALMDRPAPVYDPYPLFKRSEHFQSLEIERIKRAEPGFVLIIDRPLDGMEERRFRNTNPLIFDYIKNHFERIEGFSSNPAYHIYRPCLN
jgi:hypothetical protein